MALVSGKQRPEKADLFPAQKGKRCINMLINLQRKLQSVGDIVMWLQEILFGNVFSGTMNVLFFFHIQLNAV